jgi:ABC-type transporter Mla subunit MlaD
MWDPFSYLGSSFKLVLESAFEHFRDDRVAPALAGALIVAGFTLILILVARVVYRSWQIGRARKAVRLTKNRSEFAQQFVRLDKRLAAIAPLTLSWENYKATLVFPSPARPEAPELRATVSPQVFFNANAIGEGWRIYRAWPNLFVGIGLLLTFVGLVAALTFTTNAIGGAATAEQTQEALKDLLHAASFKFYTSIAGLLVSIALTMTLRCGNAALESRLSAFANDLECRVHLVTLEEVALEHLVEAKQQTADIKLFNDEVAIQVGNQVGHAINAALPPQLAHAMAPIEQALERVTQKIAGMSESTLGGMADEFSRKLQGNVGQEIDGLAKLLGGLRGALGEVTEQMAQTGSGLAQQVERIEKAIAGIDVATRKASELVVADLTTIGEQIAQQAKVAAGSAEAQVREAAGGLAGVVADIGANLSGSVATLTQVLMTVSEQMRGVEARIAGHRDALEGINRSAREAGGLMTSAASTLREASAPIAETGRSIGQATQRVQESLAAIQAMLVTSRNDSQALGQQLQATFEMAQKAWADYEKRFGQVDESLGKALERIVEQTSTSVSAINGYVVNLDKHLGLGIDRLGGGIEDLGDIATELKQVANGLRR